MRSYKLEDFNLDYRNPSTGDLMLKIKGTPLYYNIFKRAFPNLYFSTSFLDRKNEYDSITYVKKAGEAEKEALSKFCSLLQKSLYIEDQLTETHALSVHTISQNGSYKRTEIGQLVYNTKSYNTISHKGSKDKAQELVEYFVGFIQNHPTYLQAKLILGVPPSNKDKDFDLPAYLAEEIAKSTGQELATASITKTRQTKPMKECKNIEEKRANIEGVFKANLDKFDIKTVILIDDIYHTGTTLNEVGGTLLEAGAEMVLGLVATKTIRNN